VVLKISEQFFLFQPLFPFRALLLILRQYSQEKGLPRSDFNHRGAILLPRHLSDKVQSNGVVTVSLWTDHSFLRLSMVPPFNPSAFRVLYSLN